MKLPTLDRRLGHHARLPTLAFCVVVFASSLTACEDASKKEAQELDRAVTAYRQAENDRKPELAGAISATPCAAKDVCDARAACSTTAKATGEGLLKKRKVETFLAQELPKLSPGDPKAQEMLDELTAAEALLVKGRDSVAACDDAMLNLRRAHNLR